MRILNQRSVAALLLTAMLSGCLGLKWASFDWVNHSSQDIVVTEVSGFSELVEPGRLRAGTGPDSVGLHFGDPVRVSPKITIKWLAGHQEHQQTITRDSSAVPRVVRGTTIRFTYTEDGVWQVGKCAPSE